MSEEVVTEEVTTEPTTETTTEESTVLTDTPKEVIPEKVVPEEYTDFTFPEDVEFDEETLNEFKPLAKELKLTQEEAQRLVDLQTQVVTRLTDKIEKEYNNTVKEWADNAKADKEIGGVSFDNNMAIARKPLDVHGNNELRDVIRSTGIGNHPEFLRFLFKLGTEMSEATVETGSRPRTSEDIARRLFPSMEK